jgi:hypothetical protein
MLLKRCNNKSQAYITAGSVFFLIGIFSTMVADGRLLGALLTNRFSGSTLDLLQGFADGFSIPMLMASIYFSLRGVKLRRG